MGPYSESYSFPMEICNTHCMKNISSFGCGICFRLPSLATFFTGLPSLLMIATDCMFLLIPMIELHNSSSFMSCNDDDMAIIKSIITKKTVAICDQKFLVSCKTTFLHLLWDSMGINRSFLIWIVNVIVL